MARKNGSRRPDGASTIYYSPYDDRWHGRVMVGVRDNGRQDRRHIKRKSEREVINRVRELEQQRESGKVRKTGQSWTVEKWLTHWVENIAAPTVRPNTLIGYRAAVYGHLIPGIGAHRIDKLQPEHLERLYRNLAAKKGRHRKLLRPATIHQVHRTVRTALGEALRRGHAVTNPAQIARPPRIPEEEIIPFTKEEAGRILATSKTRRNGVRFVVALTLGLRKGEALGLQWRDIDFTNRTLTIRRSLQPVKWNHGCGDKPCGRHAGHCPSKHGGGVVAQETKTRAGRRVVGIPADVAQALKDHRGDQQREREHAGDQWHDEGWVFANSFGRPVHPRTDHDDWKALLKAAEVRNARLHDARHTAATMLLVLGVPSRAVMDVMGWSHIGMTARYQHVTAELAASIADQIGAFYWTEQEKPDDGEGESTAVPVGA